MSRITSRTMAGDAAAASPLMAQQPDIPINLYQLLSLAPGDTLHCGIRFHPDGFNIAHETTAYSEYNFTVVSNAQGLIPYNTLLQHEDGEAIIIEQLMEKEKSNIVLIHTDNDVDMIHWFWAVFTAGGIPCSISRLSEDALQRRKQVENLKKTLEDPLIITSSNIKTQYQNVGPLKIWTFQEIDAMRHQTLTNNEDLKVQHKGNLKNPEDLAVLMLTSGSTGNSKATCLTHGQMLASVKGKSAIHGTTCNDVFLNWTAFDHVAHLTEIHLHAMSLGCSQLTAPPSTFTNNPLHFLAFINKHRISYTFAPNFFMASLLKHLETASDDELAVINPVATCVALTIALGKLKAPASFVRPGSGMTETCAGFIYNAVDCPAYDVSQNKEFANLGLCVPGIEMRMFGVCRLQVKGPIVFGKYYNNPQVTAEAFTEDGWFETGDLGHLDEEGRLHLTGRSKDLIIIDGHSHLPHGIEGAIEYAQIPGVTPHFVAAFGIRIPQAYTDSLVVVHLPQGDTSERAAAGLAISKAVVTSCGVRPLKIIAVDESLLEKSTLGKITRSKLKAQYEKGDLDEYIKLADTASANASVAKTQSAATATELALLQIFNDRFGDFYQAIGGNHDLFELGVSSLDMYGLKASIQETFGITSIPLTIFFNHPIISDLACEIEKFQLGTQDDVDAGNAGRVYPELREIDRQHPSLSTIGTSSPVYDPLVLLNPNSGSTNAPMFFIHPGVGEILIFMKIARYFKDGPVYGLRGRGFNGKPLFGSFHEVWTTYLAAIRRIQPGVLITS